MNGTPTPWRVEHSPALIRLNLDEFLNSHSLRVTADGCASVYGIIPQGVVSAADAELIVRAVNNFDGLLEACRAALAAFDYCENGGIRNEMEAVKKLRAAIAKAEGKE